MMLRLVADVSWAVLSAWQVGVLVTDRGLPWHRQIAPLVWLAQELRPVVLPTLALYLGASLAIERPSSWWGWAVHGFTAAVNTYVWCVQNRDDRWKRRRRKLVERVKLVNGRLVVAPVGTQS